MMIYRLRAGLVVALSCLLVACYQTELGGKVEGAQVTISELRTGAVVEQGLNSGSLEQYLTQNSQEDFDALGSLAKMINLGNFTPDADLYINDRWYLITASGGNDMDSNIDGTVEDEFEAVSGTWRAIIRGDKLKRGSFKVSTLTDALYRAVRDDLEQLDDTALAQRLNTLGRDVVNDVDRNGSVNYTDVLAWTVLVNRNNYQFDVDRLAALAAGIAAGAAEVELDSLAAEVRGEEQVDALQFYGDNISGPIVQARCINCHTSTGVAAARGAQLIFVRNNVSDFVATNHQAFIRFAGLQGSRDLSDYVTSKASGSISHGGGRQLVEGSPELIDLETYLNLIE